MTRRLTRSKPKPGQLGIEGVGEDIPLENSTNARNDDATHESMREYLGSRRGSKREAYRSSNSQTKRSTVALEKMSLAEKVLIASETLGFHPMSPLEAMQVMYLLPDLGNKHFSTTRYLAKVMGRQSRQGTDIIDPARTAHHVVRDFGNYEADAKITKIITKRFLDETYGVNPTLKLETLNYELPTDLSIPLVRAQTIVQSLRGAHMSPDPFRNMGEEFDDLEYMAADFEGALLDATVAFNAITTVKEARDIANEVAAEQDFRANFWSDRIDEAYRFTPVRPTVLSIRGDLPVRVY